MKQMNRVLNSISYDFSMKVNGLIRK